MARLSLTTAWSSLAILVRYSKWLSLVTSAACLPCAHGSASREQLGSGHICTHLWLTCARRQFYSSSFMHAADVDPSSPLLNLFFNDFWCLISGSFKCNAIIPSGTERMSKMSGAFCHGARVRMAPNARVRVRV